MKDEEKEIIKGLYKDLLDVVEVNHPDYYIMPLEFYNGILNKVSHLDDYLKIARRSVVNYRKRAEKAEAELKELKK